MDNDFGATILSGLEYQELFTFDNLDKASCGHHHT